MTIKLTEEDIGKQFLTTGGHTVTIVALSFGRYYGFSIGCHYPFTFDDTGQNAHSEICSWHGEVSDPEPDYNLTHRIDGWRECSECGYVGNDHEFHSGEDG